MSNIIFNNKNYSIDDSFLSIHSNDLKQHLSTVMNGTGAIIKLGDVSYNVDSVKLAAAKSAFIQHLGAIAGNGYKVVIGGVEYNIDASKVASAITGLDAAWEGSQSGGNGFPIKWNTMDVIGNTTVVVGDYQFVKVSDFAPSFEQLEKTELAVATSEFTQAIPSVGHQIIGNNVLIQYQADLMMVIIGEAGEIPEFGVNFPERGIYSLDFGSMAGVNIDFIFDIPKIINGTIYEEGDYIYIYSRADGGWIVNLNEGVTNREQASYGEILESIEGEPIIDIKNTFYNCSNLTSIAIPNGVTIIGQNAFYNCKNLTNITIPDGVTSIGEKAFYNCSNLTNITIPNGVTSIGKEAFSDCISLNNVTIPDGVTIINGNTFCNCKNLTNITIPDGVTIIGGNAFCNCSNLTNITIPNRVTSIYGGAFSGCSNLTSINIPDGVTSIDSYTFYKCTSLTNITIPDGVTHIGQNAFCDCTSLTNITIPDGVTYIDMCAFDNCSSLTNVTIPNGVTSISRQTFSDCSKLANITIPSGVTSIDQHAFSNCSSLNTINFTGTVEQWNAILLRDNWNRNIPATEVICSDGVVSLV